MSKFIVVLAHFAEVKDFYKHFRANQLKKDMGWNFTFDICEPEKERPGEEALIEIEKITGLPKELVGGFSHFLGEFFLSTQVDYGSYGSPKDFTVVICEDQVDCGKLKVFATLKGFELNILELNVTAQNLKTYYEILEKFMNDEISEEDVLRKLGWEELILN